MGELIDLNAYRQSQEEKEREEEENELQEIKDLLKSIQILKSKLPPLEREPYFVSLDEMVGMPVTEWDIIQSDMDPETTKDVYTGEINPDTVPWLFSEDD